jgi:hypothetical protein
MPEKYEREEGLERGEEEEREKGRAESGGFKRMKEKKKNFNFNE